MFNFGVIVGHEFVHKEIGEVLWDLFGDREEEIVTRISGSDEDLRVNGVSSVRSWHLVEEFK